VASREGAQEVVGRDPFYRTNKRLEAWKREVAGGNYVPDAEDDVQGSLVDPAGRVRGERAAIHGPRRRTPSLTSARSSETSPPGSITTDRVVAYVRHRQEEKAANATINASWPR
jgi:hypothetical protein